jgi:hypothetical protein
MLLCRDAWVWERKKGAINAPVQRGVVVRFQQREQAVGVVSHWCQNPRDCECSHWRPLKTCSQSVIAIFAWGLSAMCGLLYRLLGAYATVLPSKQHRAVGKETGLTNWIERLKCTLQQRISRLVRKTLFSKKLDNHIGAIWFFIHDYNASLPV